MAELRRTQINVVKSKDIEGAFGSRQLRARCWFCGGRKTGEPGGKPWKHERDQLQQLYLHESQVFWESTRAIPRPGLTGNLVVKGNALTASAIRIPYKIYTNAVCTLWSSLMIQTLHITPWENGRERRVWYLTPLIASQNQLVDIQIFCGPLDTQEHKKTSHRVLKPFKIHSLDFPGFHEAIL